MEGKELKLLSATVLLCIPDNCSSRQGNKSLNIAIIHIRNAVNSFH